jgi:hypothetical protein
MSTYPYDYIIQTLEAAKVDLFSDAQTWKSSGPEYAKAASDQEYGYNLAIAQILRMKEHEEAFRTQILGMFPEIK